MIAAVIFAAVSAACFAFALLHSNRSMSSMERQHARERDLLLNQIMHLTGHTWTPPPAAEPRPEPKPRTTVRSPEQEPDGALA